MRDLFDKLLTREGVDAYEYNTGLLKASNAEIRKAFKYALRKDKDLT